MKKMEYIKTLMNKMIFKMYIPSLQFAHSVNLRQRIQRMLRTSFTFQFQKTCIGTFCVKISQPRISLIVDGRRHFILKYTPHTADVAPIYILIQHSQSSGSKYFTKYLNMKFALVNLHFDVNLASHQFLHHNTIWIQK